MHKPTLHKQLELLQGTVSQIKRWLDEPDVTEATSGGASSSFPAAHASTPRFVEDLCTQNSILIEENRELSRRLAAQQAGSAKLKETMALMMATRHRDEKAMRDPSPPTNAPAPTSTLISTMQTAKVADVGEEASSTARSSKTTLAPLTSTPRHCARTTSSTRLEVGLTDLTRTDCASLLAYPHPRRRSTPPCLEAPATTPQASPSSSSRIH